MPSTSRTVVAVFSDEATAERAVDDLVSSGFARNTIDITSNENFTSDSAIGNTGLSGQQPTDRSGGGMGGFFRRLFGTDDDAQRYDEAVRTGAVIVSVNTADEDRASEILDRNGAIDVEDRASNEKSSRGRTGGEQSIPVLNEEMHVGKREVHRGGVRIYNRMEERPVEEQVQLKEEHVHVDRRPVNRPATEADLRRPDEVIEVSEMAEEAVIGKNTRVVEEVVVGKDTTQRTETIRDTVRRTDVNVEQLGSGDRASANYETEFQRDFRSRYGSVPGAKYETYAPAYQYGHRMASDDRYRGKGWDQVESHLRTGFERDHPGGKWEQMKDSVRYGWEKVTGRR